jgi:hypothetical protein
LHAIGSNYKSWLSVETHTNKKAFEGFWNWFADIGITRNITCRQVDVLLALESVSGNLAIINQYCDKELQCSSQVDSVTDTLVAMVNSFSECPLYVN